MKTHQRIVAAIIALNASVLVPAQARADVVEIESSFSGGIWEGGITAPHFMNYFVGYSFPSTPVERRNYFIFSLTDVSDTVTGARLKLFLPGPTEAAPFLPSGYVSSDPTETYRVSGSAAPWWAFYEAFTGTATPAMLTAMFDTMGAPSTEYGIVTVSPMAAGTDIVIELNAAAIGAINASLGSMFHITGRLTDIHPEAPGMPPSELLFAYTDIPHEFMAMPRLELDIIPTPSAAVPLLAALALRPRRRR
ncbi:MAG: hypothetical protein KF859_12250 [Phycisphaeraceae bacterium]|nr:hypothetical protein [Phycisphaeraceae bacterium]